MLCLKLLLQLLDVCLAVRATGTIRVNNVDNRDDVIASKANFIEIHFFAFEPGGTEYLRIGLTIGLAISLAVGANQA